MKVKQDWKDRWMNFSNWKREGINSFWVATGLVGSMFIDRTLQKYVVEKLPESLAPYAGYIKAGGQVVIGLALSTAMDDKDPGSEKFRLIGYGITGSGVVSGLRMIPAVNQFLSGPISGLNGAERLLGLSLGNFGAAENVKQISTADAEGVDLDLPDLGTPRLPFAPNAHTMQVRTPVQVQVKQQTQQPMQPQQQTQTQSQPPHTSVRYQPQNQWQQNENAGQYEESDFYAVDFSQIL